MRLSDPIVCSSKHTLSPSSRPVRCVVRLEPSQAPGVRVAALAGLCEFLWDSCDLLFHSSRASPTATHCLMVSLAGMGTTPIQNNF